VTVLIWVASYPRSGNTLTLLVLRDVFGTNRLGSDFNDDFSLGKIPDHALPGRATYAWDPPRQVRGLSGDALLDSLRARPEAYFIKTHRLARASDPAPALYLVRDGRDALVSQAHLVKANDVPRFRNQSFDRRLAELIDPGIRSQGGWSRNVRAWRERSAPTAVIRFEDLIADPVAAISRECAAIGAPLGEPTAPPPSFDRLRELAPWIFRRGALGSWRDEMSPELERRFWRLHGREMRALGYPRARHRNPDDKGPHRSLSQSSG
jgi:hypothetical protein